MSFSLIIDDSSLILLLLIILTLCVSLYLSSNYTPLIHPLILSRQSEVSKVRNKNQSPIYRNSNSPSGFQLANKPRRKVVDVNSILQLGSTGEEIEVKRQVLAREKSGNRDVIKDSRCLVNGLSKLKDSNQLVVGIHTHGQNSYPTLLSIISSGDKQPSDRSFNYNALIIPHDSKDLPTNIPKDLIGNDSTQLVNVLVLGSLRDEDKLNRILSSSILDPTSVIIVDESRQVEGMKSFISKSDCIYSGNKFQVLSFDEVLQVGKQLDVDNGNGMELEENDSEEQRLSSIQSHYWKGSEHGFIPIHQESLTAGITSQLALFPADQIPSSKDRILILSDAEDDLLISSRHPSGLILDLLSLYTGAALFHSRVQDGNQVSKALECEPTLIYSTPKASSILLDSLTSKSSSSSLLWKLAKRSKLVSLRYGNLGKNSVWDWLVLNPFRSQNHIDKLRFISLQGSGVEVSQNFLDELRLLFGCPVIHSYHPSQVLQSKKGGNPALIVAPISASHTLDLQTFSDGDVAVHCGPPSVSLELVLDEDHERMKSQGLKIDQFRNDSKGRRGDFLGEVQIRGKTITSLDEQDWFRTGDLGQIRSNGTLVVVESSKKEENQLIEIGKDGKTHKGGSRKSSFTSTSTLTLFLTLSFSLISMVKAASSTPSSQLQRSLTKRENYSPNDTLANACRMGMLSSPRATWEQGVAQSALLEFEHGQWSVFNGEDNGPAFRPNHVDLDEIQSHPPWSVVALAYRSSYTQDGLGRLGVYVTGDEPGGNLSTGSSLDSASMGEGVLLSAFIEGQLRDGVLGTGMYARSAQRQLDYVLNDVVRLPNGAISQRINTQEVWSDSLYMLPPFLAACGLYTSNQTLLQLAYDQVRLSRDYLRIQDGPGANMYMHIYNSTNITNSDTGAWATGNGWSTAGMVRVLASIAQSPFSQEMNQQKLDLADWTKEILDAAYPFLDSSSGLFHNYINATTEFNDASGSAIMAYATFRLASMSPDYAQHIEEAEMIYQTIQDKVSPIGVYEGVDSVYALGFTTPGPTSSESLAFNLLLMAARRDYHQGNVTGLDGPGTGNENSSSNLKIKHHVTLLIGALALGLSLL